MIKQLAKHNRVGIVLEIALVGLFLWVALAQPGNNVTASGQQFVKVSENQGQQERTLPIEGAPELRAQNLLAEVGTPGGCLNFDFAGGNLQGFTVEPVMGATLWHGANSVCRAFLTGHTTPYTFYYGQDGTCNYNTGARNASNLISPSISLAGKFPPYSIGFNYLLFVEGGGFDSTFVDISTNNGMTWTQILSKANLINDNQWHNRAIDVTAQVGAATAIKLRFRFDSVDNIANSTTGWHVDDLLVCGQPFNFCVQDDSTGDYVQLNTVTGAYTVKQCSSGFISSGVGTVTTNGCNTTVTQNSNGVFNTIRVDTCANTGNAEIRVRSGFSIKAFNIVDSNTTNNSCICP